PPTFRKYGVAPTSPRARPTCRHGSRRSRPRSFRAATRANVARSPSACAHKTGRRLPAVWLSWCWRRDSEARQKSFESPGLGLEGEPLPRRGGRRGSPAKPLFFRETSAKPNCDIVGVVERHAEQSRFHELCRGARRQPHEQYRSSRADVLEELARQEGMLARIVP